MMYATPTSGPPGHRRQGAPGRRGHAAPGGPGGPRGHGGAEGQGGYWSYGGGERYEDPARQWERAESSRQAQLRPIESQTETVNDDDLFCSCCSVKFHLRDLRDPYGGGSYAFPYHLKCLHSACFGCIRRAVTGQRTVCRLCQKECLLTPQELASIKKYGNDGYKAAFPLNRYHIGTMHINMYIDTYRKPQSSTQPMVNRVLPLNFLPASNFRNNLSNEEKCGECKKKATVSCLQCSIIFCDECFKKIHSFVALKSHMKEPIADKQLTNCTVHINTRLHCYCNDCSIFVCKECISSNGSCHGHAISSLIEKNLEILDQIKRLRPKLESVLYYLNKNEYDVKTEVDCFDPDSDFSILSNKLKHSFSTAIAAIQMESLAALENFQKFKSIATQDLQKTHKELEMSKSNIRSLLSAVDTKLNEPNQGIEPLKLLKTVEKALHTPCIWKKEEHVSPLSIKFDNDLANKIRNLCTTSYKQYKRIQLQELLPDDSDDIEIITADEDSQEVVMLDDAESIISSKASESTQMRCDKDFQPDELEQVTIAHITSPGEFYVRRESQMPAYRELMEHLNSNPPNFCQPEDLRLGKMFVTYDEKVESWYRVIVENVIPTDMMVKAKYVDIGHRAMIPASTIGPIDEKSASVSPLLLRCYLPCLPTGSEWTDENTKMMEKILYGYEFYNMKINYRESSSAQVDLYTISSSPIDLPVCLARSMVFLGHAKYHSSSQMYQYDRFLEAENPRFKKDEVLQSDDEVSITYVPNPNCFFVRKLESEGYYNNIKYELNSKYHIDREEEGMIYNPKKDLCIACYDIQRSEWTRGTIIYVENQHKITVKFVDFGHTETMSWTHLRKLQMSHLDISEMAIKCRLALLPSVIHRKSSEATKFLEECGQSWVPSKVQVLKVSFDMYDVELTASINGKVLVVNQEFINRGFVVSLGSDRILYPPVQPNIECDKNDEKPSCQSQETNKSSEKKTQNKQSQSQSRSLEEDMDKKEDDTQIYVKIISAKDPSCLYVSFVSDEIQLMTLFDSMRLHYDTTEFSPVEWKEDDKCAALSVTKRWHRALVQSVDEENQTAALFFKDIATMETVSFENMRQLDDQFLNTRDGAIRCHMPDIQPSCSDTWPNLTCEYLKEIISTRREFKIEPIGAVDNRSWPVRLWVLIVDAAEALEPIKEEWKSVSGMIVEQGLAVRKDGYEIIEPSSQKSENEVYEVYDEAMIIDPDPVIIKRITKWLPAEPPKRNIFIGIPSSVDVHFNIYIFVPEFHVQVKELEKYNNSSPGPEDKFWEKGQPCIAQFALDSKYYRAVIEEIKNNSMVIVKFVDYGNSQEVHVSKLRKNLVGEDIPLQVLKCRVPDIKPRNGTEWTEQVVDYAHKELVEARCLVEVLGQDGDGVANVRIKINNVDFVDLMMMKGFVDLIPTPHLDPIEGMEEIKQEEPDDLVTISDD